MLTAERLDAKTSAGALRAITLNANRLARDLPRKMAHTVTYDQGQLLARSLRAGIEDVQLRRRAEQWALAAGTEKETLAMDLGLWVTPDRLRAALSRAPLMANPPVGRARGWVRTSEGYGASYQIHVPAQYTPDKKWPVHISLHGGGGTPSRSCAVNWNGEPEKSGVILVCPKAHKGMWWMPRGEASIQAVLMDLRTRYNVDTDRVSIGGASSGGFGVWHNAAKYPWVFRAAVPRCAATPKDPETLGNLSEMATYMLHGARDGTISVKQSRRSHRLLSAVSSDVTYREEPGFGHSFMRPRNFDVMSWLSPKRRELSESFHYRTMARGPAPGRVHFLVMDWGDEYVGGIEVEGRIVAHRSAGQWVNEVYVDSTAAIDGFTVLLKEGQGRPDAPVRVFFNDELVHEGPAPQPSVRAVLESWKDHKDPALVATHAVHVQLATR
jgi:acetyl esterase/lipase